MMTAKVSDRKYEDFDPVSDLITEEGCDTLILYLPGFKKEQLKVQLTTSRILRISGERPIGDNKWRRFSKEFRVPSNVDTKEITAKFEGGLLHIRQPKLITPATAAAGEEDKAKQAAKIPKPQTQQEAPSSQPEPARKSDGYVTPPSELPGEHEVVAKMDEKEQRKDDEAARSANEETHRKYKEMKRKIDSSEKDKQVVKGSGLFKKLKKPEIQKRVVISVLLLIVLTLFGFQIAKMFGTNSGDDLQNLLEYFDQGLLHPT